MNKIILSKTLRTLSLLLKSRVSSAPREGVRSSLTNVVYGNAMEAQTLRLGRKTTYVRIIVS